MKNWKKTYRVQSWSDQARKRANSLFDCAMYMTYRNIPFRFHDNMGEFHDNITPEQYVAHSLSISHKPDIIRYRAAKRFGRMWRRYQKHLAK